MKRKLLLTLPIFLLIASYFSFLKTADVQSIPPRNVKDVLSNSQFSYYGGLAVGNTAGNTIIKIDVSSSFPSKTSNNLFIGDTISIGLGGSQSTYIVKDIGNTSTIILNTGISAVAIPAGGSVIATRSAIHTVHFEPTVNATGGFWQFLIKATSTAGEVSSSNGIPDQGGFDLGTLDASAVSCPFGATASVGTTTSVSLGSPATTSYYHVIQCALGAGVTSAVGTGVTMTIGDATKQLINPSPSHSAASEGNADIFNFIVRQLDASSTVLDQLVGKLAIVESVRVTATVDPTLTFTIDNVGATDVGSTACGAGTTLSSGAAFTTGDQVVFGSIGLGSFNQLAQRLSVITNAPNGYVVTVHESGPMRNIGTTDALGLGVSIPDTLCSGNNCTITSAQPWTTVSSARSEFGYTMNNVGSSIPFTAGNFKPFGIGSTSAAEIMKRVTNPIITESAYVCYRITATTAQMAGDYEGKVIYTATATF